MSPKLQDEMQKMQNEEHLQSQTKLDAFREAATALLKQIKSDMDFMSGQQPVRDKDGKLNIPESQNKMGNERINERLDRLEKAAEELDAISDRELSQRDAALIEQLRSALDTATNPPKPTEVEAKASEFVGDASTKNRPREVEERSEKDELQAVAERAEKATAEARADLSKTGELDNKSSDEQYLARQSAEQRLETLERLQEVAEAAADLLNEMQHGAVSIVPRQEIQKPNPEKRKKGETVMGKPAGESYNWIHMLARCFGGADKFTNVNRAREEPHKDMSRLEDNLRRMRGHARIEIEITCAHKAVKSDPKDLNRTPKVKDREGYELRFQAWISDKTAKPDPNAKPNVDVTLNLQSESRDASLRPIFEELGRVRDDLKAGRSPEEAVRRLAEVMKQETAESPAEEEIRKKRIWNDMTEGKIDY